MLEVITTHGLNGRDYSYIDVRGPLTVTGGRSGSTITTEIGTYHTEHPASKVTASILKARKEPLEITRVQA